MWLVHDIYPILIRLNGQKRLLIPRFLFRRTFGEFTYGRYDSRLRACNVNKIITYTKLRIDIWKLWPLHLTVINARIELLLSLDVLPCSVLFHSVYTMCMYATAMWSVFEAHISMTREWVNDRRKENYIWRRVEASIQFHNNEMKIDSFRLTSFAFAFALVSFHRQFIQTVNWWQS